ncbi:uncharacterized protein LOC115703057 [Cannabis sativa]|uniref:uncharacterized protein LOC115703057 n=1 Tax=Cannabis sativa TaxID=3483 RepID=UPI0029CA68C8|nr:uncharacterized protein LOC115703057 [Cannabis sativa]
MYLFVGFGFFVLTKGCAIVTLSIGERSFKMDRNWMSANRLSAEYSEGVDHFLDFCQKNAKNTKLVLCPCLKCGNMERVDIASIKEHLFRNGIDKSYKVWVYHGEKNRVPGEGTSKSNKVKGVNLEYEDDHIPKMIGDAQYELNVDPLKFQSFVEDAEKPIYPNCNRFTKLSTLIRLYNIKAKHGWSDKSFSDLLAFLVELLPEGNVVPSSFYEAKKTLSSLGMQYEKIHACPNDDLIDLPSGFIQPSTQTVAYLDSGNDDIPDDLNFIISTSFTMYNRMVRRPDRPTQWMTPICPQQPDDK